MLDSVASLFTVFMVAILALLLLNLFGAYGAAHSTLVGEFVANVIYQLWIALERIVQFKY